MYNWNRMPDALKEQVFKHLEQLAAVANLSEADRIAYDKAVDSFNVSRIVEEDIRREGWEGGMREGHRKGMQEGIRMNQRSIVLNMKKAGVPLATIASYTGLSVEEIKAL